MPQFFINHNRKNEVTQLVKAYWIEQLIINKLLDPATSTIIQCYYSKQLVKEWYKCTQLEVKLYGDTITKGGLDLVDLCKFRNCDVSNIPYTHQSYSRKSLSH